MPLVRCRDADPASPSSDRLNLVKPFCLLSPGPLEPCQKFMRAKRFSPFPSIQQLRQVLFFFSVGADFFAQKFDSSVKTHPDIFFKRTHTHTHTRAQTIRVFVENFKVQLFDPKHIFRNKHILGYWKTFGWLCLMHKFDKHKLCLNRDYRACCHGQNGKLSLDFPMAEGCKIIENCA